MGIAEHHMGGLKGQSLTNTAWVAWPFATAGCESPTPTILDVNARYYSEALSARDDLTVFDAFHQVFKFAAGSQTFRPDQQGRPTAINAFQK